MPTKIISLPVVIPLEQRIASRVSADLDRKFSEVAELIATTNKALIAAQESNQYWASQITASIATLNTTLEKLLISLSNLGLPFENPPEVYTRRITLTTANTAVQLPPFKIPFDKEVVIMAHKDNAGIIYVGNGQLEAENSDFGYPLDATKSVSYKVRNLQQLWVRADTANDKVIWTVEKE